MNIPARWPYRDGQTSLEGEIYIPAEPGKGKAVLVVHEADGIGGNVRRHCALLAQMGYIAAAADMHGKGRPLTDAEIPEAMQAFAENRATLVQRLRSAVDALESECGLARNDIAAIGYCFGGMAVLELA